MIDLNKIIADMLKNIAPVQFPFPNLESQFPLITITQVSNTADLIFDGEERLSRVVYQIDVWDNSQTPENCEKLAIQVNEEMTKAGFKRSFGQLFVEKKEPFRMCMRFSGRIDEKNYTVYQ